MYEHSELYNTSVGLFISILSVDNGKQTIASLASELWQELPTDLKNLGLNCFSKQVKQQLQRKQSYS